MRYLASIVKKDNLNFPPIPFFGKLEIDDYSLLAIE